MLFKTGFNPAEIRFFGRLRKIFSLQKLALNMNDINLLKITYLLTKRNQSHKKMYNLKNTPYFKFSFLSFEAKIKTPLLTDM